MAEPVPVPIPLMIRHSWTDHAACRSRTKLFFPPFAERPQARVRREAKARRICEQCPVLEVCRLHARVHGEYGFWGGESEDERAAAGYAAAPSHTPALRSVDAG